MFEIARSPGFCLGPTVGTYSAPPDLLVLVLMNLPLSDLIIIIIII